MQSSYQIAGLIALCLSSACTALSGFDDFTFDGDGGAWSDGGADAGELVPDAGQDAQITELDAGTDAATPRDAGTDAGELVPDAGQDAQITELDAGTDAATPRDAGTDAGEHVPDAGGQCCGSGCDGCAAVWCESPTRPGFWFCSSLGFGCKPCQ